MVYYGNTELYKKPWYLATFTVMASLQLILASSTIYGYSSLLVIFKSLYLYKDKCKDFNMLEGFQNSTNGGRDLPSDPLSCPLQDKALNLPFAVAMVLNCLVKIPLGNMIDRYGAKSCQYIGCLLLMGFGFSLGYVEEGREYLLFVAFIFLSCASSLLMLCPFQVTNILYTRGKAFFISLLSGCVDGATVVFILFLEIYQAHIAFPSICIAYSVGTSILVMISTHFLIPSKDVLEKIVQQEITMKMRPEDSELSEEESLCKMRSEDFSASYMSSYDMFYDAIHTSLDQLKETERREALLASLSQNMAIQYYQASHHNSFSQSIHSVQSRAYGTIRENIIGFEPDCHTSISYFDPSLQTLDESKPLIAPASTPKKTSRLLTPYSGDKFSAYYFSKLNILCTYVVGIMLFKIVYLIGNLDKYLALMTNDPEIVTSNIKLFGYLQFGGVVAAPLCSLLFINRRGAQNKLSAEEDYFEKIKQLILPAFVFTLILVSLDALQLFQNLQLSVPIFTLYLFGNSLLFCYVSLFYAYLFPAQYYCSFYGICIGIAGVFSFLQYPLLYIEQDILHGQQFKINVMFLFAILSTLVLPIYLFYYYKRYRPIRSLETEKEDMEGMA